MLIYVHMAIKERLSYDPSSYIDENGDVLPAANVDDGFDAVGSNVYLNDEYNERRARAALQQEREAAWEEEANREAEDIGVAVPLGERATNLTAALNWYTAASKLQGLLDSNDGKKIQAYGGRDGLKKAIQVRMNEGKKALAVGYGIDRMLAKPDMVPDEDGFPFDELQAQYLLVMLQRSFINTYTAEGVRREQGLTAAERRERLKAISQNRQAFHRSLRAQLPK